MDGQRGQGEGHEHLEGAALERPFLDPVDLEDRQKQCQVKEVAHEQAQAAPARFRLAWIKPVSVREPGLSVSVSAREDTAGAAPVWVVVATELRVSVPMGPPPSPGSSDPRVVARDCHDPAAWPATAPANGQPYAFPEPIAAGQPVHSFKSFSRQRAGLDGSSDQDGRTPDVGMLDVARQSSESAGAGSSVNR